MASIDGDNWAPRALLLVIGGEFEASFFVAISSMRSHNLSKSSFVWFLVISNKSPSRIQISFVKILLHLKVLVPTQSIISKAFFFQLECQFFLNALCKRSSF